MQVSHLTIFNMPIIFINSKLNEQHYDEYRHRPKI